jgi:peptidoglycan/LPS O-acetylase OafA/YrhL
MPDLSEPASRWKGRLPSLDGIRALSFLLVFVSHLGFMQGRPGGFGVSVFFVLSGYLITTLLIREFQKTGNISLRSFYVRRTARIFPGMYLTLIACLLLVEFHVVSGTNHFVPSLLEFAYLENYADWYGLAHGFDYKIRMTAAFWSLCVEEHFYLLFPGFFLLLLQRKASFERICKILIGICFTALIWRLIAVRIIPSGEEYCYRATDSRLESILWGCFLANLEQIAFWRRFLTYERLTRILIPIGLVFLLGTFVFPNFGRMTFRFTLQGIGLLPLIYFTTHFPKTLVVRPLNHPFLVHLGILSYALYLTHIAVLTIVSTYFHRLPVIWLLTALFTYLVALSLHTLVELPMEAVRARFRKA